MTSPTATGLLADWVTSLREDDRSTHTIRAYAGAIQRFFAWYEREEGRPPTLADLTPVALTGYRHDLQHRQKQATRSVNSAVAAIRAFCRWLTEQGHLPTNPAARLKAIGQQAPPAPQGLSDREVHALLRAAGRTRHPARDYALVQLLLQTGLRIGECAALDYEDLVIGERRGSLFVRGGKGNKARTVPLNASARAALVAHAAPALGTSAAHRFGAARKGTASVRRPSGNCWMGWSATWRHAGSSPASRVPTRCATPLPGSTCGNSPAT